MNKFKEVTLRINGKLYNFTLVTEDEKQLGAADLCEKYCPYSKMCINIPHPADMNNNHKHFVSFCNNINDYVEGKDKDPNLEYTSYPARGAIEELFKEMGSNMYKNITSGKNDLLIKVSDVIDSLCPDTCDLYDPKHTKCNSKNSYCILHILLKKDGKQ